MSAGSAPEHVVLRHLRSAFAIDLRSLAAMRIALALILLADLALRLPWLQEHYTDAGILPRRGATPVNLVFSLYFIDGGLGATVFLFGLAGIFACMLGFGYRTRLATFGSWLLLCSLQVRNDGLLNGGDLVLRLLLMWGFFLPLGARFAVDAPRRASGSGAPATVSSVATAALLLQLVLIYLFAGINKLHPEWLTEGIAIERVMNGDYARQPMQSLLLMSPGLMRFMTLTIVPIEILGPLALLLSYPWPWLRTAIVFAFFAFQLGLGSSMELMLFPFCVTTGTLPFLPGAFWDRVGIGVAQARDPAEAPAPEPPATRTSWARVWFFAVQAFVAVLLAYTFASNFKSSGWIHVPRSIVSLAQTIGLKQGWHLYAPHPPLWDPTWETHGLLANGRGLDLRTGPFWKQIGPLHESHRMRRLLDTKVRPPKGGRDVALYADWICRTWNANAERESDLTHVRLMFFQRWTLEPEGPVDRRYMLLEHECGTRV